MDRPRYIEGRLARLEAAQTAALALPDLALAAELDSERDLLLGAPAWEIADRTVRGQARLALWGWFTLGHGARDAIVEDPVLRALGEQPQTTEELDLLLQVPPDGGPEDNWLDKLRAALVTTGGEEMGNAAFDEALIAAYRSWFLAGPHPHPYPFDDVVVLLPVRVETYFPDNTHLWLRVMPDEASIRRDVPTIAPDEATGLSEFWSAALKASGFITWSQPAHKLFELPQTGPAWERLCAQVTPQRAAWLVGTFPPTPASLVAGSPTVEIPGDRLGATKRLTNRIAGFPETIDVWAIWGDDTSLRRLTPASPPTPIDPGRLVLDFERIKASRRHLAGEDILVEDRAWWMDWDAAQAIGLGLIFDLPAGCTPATLRALYVTGQSDDAPSELFRAHADAGELAILPLGMPTNAVAGSQTDPAPPPDDPATWRKVADRRLLRAAGHPPTGLSPSLGRDLTGDADALPALPREEDILLEEMPDMSFILARALWPALRGHLWRDIHGLRESAEALRQWAQFHFAPEGPWCPIRIGDQPYGLLPVSLLDGWKVEPEPADPGARVEEHLALQLRPLRDAWARAARRTGTARGRNASEFLDLLGKDALARSYVFRWFLPAEFFVLPYILEGYMDADSPALFLALRQAYERFDGLLGIGVPERFYLTRGSPSDLELPLVKPTAWRDDLQLKEVTDRIANAMEAREALAPYMNREEIPRSLLVRLLINSAFMATGAIGQEQEEQRPGGQRPSLLNPLLWFNELTSVEATRQRFNPGEQQVQSDVLMHVDFVAGMLDAMQEYWTAPENKTVAERGEYQRKEAALERALRATLDSAAHRIDPWITGLATRRLRATAAASTASYRLGIYGWLDGSFVGSPGPTEGGLLHTPSHAQTLAAVILRDKYLTARLEGDADATNPWAMNLDSRSVRLVEELADEIRIGSHPYEALGRRVEQAVGSRERVATLRQSFPLRPAAVPQDPNTVCDGLAALREVTLAGLYDQLDAAQKLQIDLLRRSTDVYGDLLVAEAVHSVVSGRPDSANAAMEAAAGLGRPADLEFVQTPDSGIALKSSVLSLLPAADEGPSPRPAAVADASVAAWIDEALGSGWEWRLTWWRAGPGGDTTPADATDVVTLEDMELTPADAALLPEDLLNGIAAAIGRARLPSLLAGLTEAEASAAHLEVTAPARHSQARGVVVMLGGPPATAEDLASSEPARDAADTTWMAAFNAGIASDLRARYYRLRTAAQDLAVQLEALPTPATVRQALLWGLLPGSAPDAQDTALGWLYGGNLLDADAAKDLADAAAAALRKRWKAAPPPEPPAEPDATELSERTLRRAQEIARAIAELGSADGHMAVLARVDRAEFATRCALTSDPGLESEWLTTVAPVRRDLARVEAWNLEVGIDAGLPPLAPFSNSPGDPWQTAAAAAVMRQRAAATDEQRLMPWTPHLVAVFAAPGWQASTAVAVGVIDGWTEAVPTLRRSTRAAFGFNAPSARAPQAILLAVPPVARTWLSPERLAAIVAETHMLTHARAARLEDLAADYKHLMEAAPGEAPTPYHDLYATMMMQTPPYTGITLSNQPLWD
jgi:hypothetical protein